MAAGREAPGGPSGVRAARRLPKGWGCRLCKALDARAVLDSRFRGNDGLRKTLGRTGGTAIAEGMGLLPLQGPPAHGRSWIPAFAGMTG